MGQVISNFLMQLNDLKLGATENSNQTSYKESVVSFQSEISLPIQLAMKKFIELHPHWDQYRLIKAALSGFLIQNGVQSRSINRLYVGNMFGRNIYDTNS